jgi:uncharacterized membrane protein
MVLANIVIWGLIIAFIIWLVQDLRTRPHRHHAASGASAREILDRRLAGGKIDAGEYQRLRGVLAEPAGEQLPATGSPVGAPT